MNLFLGYTKAYGVYKLTGNEIPDDTGKMKGEAYTINRPVTVQLISEHLRGKQGIGIIPINEQNQVKFAALDIDIYQGFDLDAFNRRVLASKIPLCLCRTKSGGAHLFLFMRDFADAGLVHRRMREFAAYLGFGNCEIFPKNTKILVERGDMGQWINLPYFDDAKTLRYGLGDKSKPLSLEKFIDYAKSRSVTVDELVAIRLIDERLEGGPPCLQHLLSQGFPKGTRNNGLFNLAVYARKAQPDNWQKLVEDFNANYMDPPLTSEEVLGVIKSAGRKDYAYTCKQSPIQQYCNAAKCRGCKFGVGNNSLGMPKFGTLTKLRTSPPIWFLEVEGGGRLELSTDDLQSPMHFQNRCMEALNIMPAIPKRETWQELVAGLLADVLIIDVPAEVTPEGQLKGLLEEFCTSRVAGKTHDDLLLGKPWTNNGATYFRFRDFLDYLSRQGFKDMKANRIAMYLRDWGADKDFFNIKGKGVNVYVVKEFKRQSEGFDVPKIGGEVSF
jgi:hypothetical protein